MILADITSLFLFVLILAAAIITVACIMIGKRHAPENNDQKQHFELFKQGEEELNEQDAPDDDVLSEFNEEDDDDELLAEFDEEDDDDELLAEFDGQEDNLMSEDNDSDDNFWSEVLGLDDD